MRLKGKIVLITGGSRGIGKSIAELFVKEGAKIIITSKNESMLKKTSKELGDVFYVKGDIRNNSDVEKVIKKIIKKFGKIDVLINNAGVFPKFKKLHNISEKEWNEVIDVNLNGSFRFTKAVIPHMMKSGGSIINMSSDAGIRSFENFYADAYTASKSALVMLTKAWAVEYAKDKIRVNCVCAAVVDTDMTKKIWLVIEKSTYGNSGSSYSITKTAETIEKAVSYKTHLDALNESKNKSRYYIELFL